jgi:hypothetical protein
MAPEESDHRIALWNALLDADMNVSYWTWISDSCTTWDHWLKVLIAVAASGTVAAWGIWSQYPAAWKVLSGVACIASIIHPVFFGSERLKRISQLVATWKDVYAEYDLLWEQDSDLNAENSWKRFETAKRRESAIDETALPKKDSLARNAYEHVCRKRGLNAGKRAP